MSNKEDDNDVFVFFSPRMIEEMNNKAIKKASKIDCVNRIKRGLKSKDLIW